MRLAAFIISLLLLGGAIDPTAGWLATLTALTGIAAFRINVFWPFSPRPALDVRMASFVLAVLLLAGTVEATQGWLIALSVATGVAMVCPGIVSVDSERRDRRRWERWERWLAWDNSNSAGPIR
jgi:hypothetical protein